MRFSLITHTPYPFLADILKTKNAKTKLLQFYLRNQEFPPNLSTTVDNYIVEGAVDATFP